MLYVGTDLSRKRLDWHALDRGGVTLATGAVTPHRDGLARLVCEVARIDEADDGVVGVIESMNGARFVHDQLELAGWEMRIADPRKARGIAPLAAKTDKIDAWVLAELARLDLVPEIWLPTPGVREERERARFRLHLVRHRTMLKHRVHATLLAHGAPCPVADLFGNKGRQLLDRLALPEPWRGTLDASIRMLEHLDEEISQLESDLRKLGADHPYVPTLMTAPGIAWILGYTIAAEIGDITRFATPAKLVGYTGLAPRVSQSGSRDHRGSLTKAGPPYLRWALVEAAQHAAQHTAYNTLYEHTKQRLGRQRGAKVAKIVVARKLAEAIWWMLHRGAPFAPKGV